MKVEKRRYQSPRTGATGWRWYFDHSSCPEWGYVRKRDAMEALASIEAGSAEELVSGPVRGGNRPPAASQSGRPQEQGPIWSSGTPASTFIDCPEPECKFWTHEGGEMNEHYAEVHAE